MSLDVMRARVAFRDRAFIDVMDLALRFLAEHWRLYAKVSLIVLVPCVGLTVGAGAAWGWATGWGFAFALSFLAQVPFTVLASRAVFKENVAARAVVRSAARELPRILVMRVLWMVPVGIGATFLVAPGAFFAALFLYVDEVMILERSRIIPSFSRSQRITMASMGNALACLVMTVAVPTAAVMLADVGGRAFLGDILQFNPPLPLWINGGSVLAIFGWFGIVPYVTTARFFSYLNTRTRAEGWDIQTRFAAIAARAEQDQPA